MNAADYMSYPKHQDETKGSIPLQNSEIVNGDVTFDGRVILYIIKSDANHIKESTRSLIPLMAM